MLRCLRLIRFKRTPPRMLRTCSVDPPCILRRCWLHRTYIEATSKEHRGNEFALLSLFATPRLRVKTGWPLFTAAIVRAASLPGAERCRFQSLQTCYHLFNIFVFLFAFHIGQPLLQLSKVVLDNGLERGVGTEALLIALHLLGIVDIVGQNMGFYILTPTDTGS